MHLQIVRQFNFLIVFNKTQQKGVWGMPKASEGEEGRGKRRNAVGTRWQGLIHRCPNGATHWLVEPVLYFSV